MKSILSFAFLYLLCTPLCFAQAWQEIDITSSGLGGFTSITEHKGKLFGISYNKALVVSTDGGATFTDITTDTLYGQQDFVGSAGNKLFVGTWRALQLEGRVYYSEDEGSSWTLDTAGGVLPSARFISFESYNNGTQVVAQFQGDDNYLRRDVNANGWARIDTFYKNSNDPLHFTGSNDTILAITPVDVQFSVDNALTWTAMPGAGLSNYYNALGFDYENDRIYFIEKLFNKDCKLFYSDNFGTSFDTVSLSSFFDKNHFGTDQLAYTLKAVNNQVWISIENEQSNTVIDIITSADRGATWQYDTAGLHIDPFGTDGVADMLVHKNEIYARCVLGRLYKKGLNNVGLKEQGHRNTLALFPNPANENINLSLPSKYLGETLRIYNSAGTQVLDTHIYQLNISLSIAKLPPGMYTVRVDDASARFVKLQ